MKKLWLIAFLFNIISLTGFAELKETTASCKITLPFLELKGAVKNPFEKPGWNYGLMFTSKPFTPLFPVTFKAGNLSAGGSLSHLNSPELSGTLSAFSGTTLKLKDLDVSLPSDTSFPKPNALFVQAATGNKKVWGNTSLFYDKTSLTTSLSVNTVPFSLPQKLTFGINLTGGIYTYKSNTRSTWFNEQGFYHAGGHICAGTQLYISYGKNSTLFTINTYESPHGIYQNTYRTETVLNFKEVSFNLSAFINKNEGIITSSGKTLEPVLQFNGGGQLKKTIQAKKKLTLTTGINLQADINLNSDIHSAKTALGFKLTGSGFSVSLTSNVNLNIKKFTEGLNVDFSSGNIKAALGFSIYDFKPDISAGFTFSPDTKNKIWNYTEKIGLNIEYAGLPEITWNNTLTLTQKKENKISFTSSLSAKAQFRFCSLRVHLEFRV